MTERRWRVSVRLRLALMASAGAVVALLALSLSLNLLLEQTLTADVDGRLAERFAAARTEVAETGSVETAIDTSDPEFREPVLVWHYTAAGALVPAGDIAVPALALPLAARVTMGTRTTTIGSTRFRLRVDHSPDGGILIVGASLASLDQTIAKLHLAEFTVEPALAVLVFAGAYFFARAALRPVEQMRSTAEEVAEGRFATRFRPEAPFDELGRLAATFDEMLDRLEQVRQRQDQLTADASHELRTPLAAIESEASLALRHERSASDYRRSLEAVSEHARRMASVVDEILWLARADSGVTTPAAEPQDLVRLAREAAHRFDAIALARGLDLRAVVPAHAVVVAAPPRWLERMVDALLDNACKYTPSGGRVEVAVARTGADSVTLSVSDTGPGIPASEAARLRQRFQHGDPAAGAGSGLGLAVADAVARATQGRLEIGGGPGGGTVVKVAWVGVGEAAV